MVGKKEDNYLNLYFRIKGLKTNEGNNAFLTALIMINHATAIDYLRNELISPIILPGAIPIRITKSTQIITASKPAL